MWLVNAALRRPYTVWVGMLLVLVLGLISYFQTPTDILPNLKIPVVVVYASYRGMPAPDMEQSVTIRLERVLTRCDHLEHIESRSLLGAGIIKLYFRSQVDPDVAASQVISLVSSELQNLPPGTLMPTVLKYDATAIPVGELVISSSARDDRYLLDLADHQLRDALSNIQGLASAPVFGGVLRQVQVYVDPRKLEAYHLSSMDVVDRLNKQTQVIPTGEIRIARQTFYVTSNSMVETPEEFAQIPIGADGRKLVYLGDVAEIVDAARWRTNTVRADGRRVVSMPLLRQAGASAVRVVDNVKAQIPRLYEHGTLPEDVSVEVAFDQSQYVRDALENLRLEALGGAVLASLVVLLFLGSIRTTWIVALAIPLSILAAFLGLYFAGMTINIMTLGGLALVLGRVIDDSIVDVENTVRHLDLGKTPLEAARDSAHEISVPVLIATVTTVVVFLPLLFMEGVGKYLFMPMALAASLALFASYLVSRTVSPLYCSRFLRPRSEGERFPWLFFVVALGLALVGLGAWLLKPYLAVWLIDGRLPVGGMILRGMYYFILAAGCCGAAAVALAPLVALLFWIAPGFDRLYETSVRGYERLLRFCLRWRVAVVGLLLILLVPTVLGARRLGQELFPEVDASEFTIHMRATGGPRVEETEEQVQEIERIIRGDPDRGIAAVIPPEDLELVLANIGINARWSAIYTPNNGPHAAFVRVQLRSGFSGRKTPTLTYVQRLRERLVERFPSNDFFFETSGITRRILNAGAVAPIEVQILGHEAESRRAVAHQLAQQIARHPQVQDTYLPQGMDLPQLHIDVDRRRAALLNYNEADVVRNVIVALMSSAQIAPNFWIDPRTGNPYLIGVQYPESAVQDVQTLENIPISGKTNGPVRLIKDVARIERTQGPVEMYHYDSTRVSQLFINVTGNDLAGVAAEVDRIVNQPPLEYALNNLPADKQELAEDEGFRQKLQSYLGRNRVPLREAIRKQYGINPDRLKLPPGVRVEVRGEVSSMRESFKWMAGSLLLAVLLVYLVMAAQFQSWLDPLITIVSAPLGLIGVVAILVLTNTSLNVQTCMGVLMMIGISVSNSVLVVEFANRQRAAGLDTLTAIIHAARIRMRPILMTTIATVAGLVPMAIHLRPGDEMNLPLARTVIGGLAASTVLTLFVVPVLYVLLKPRGTAVAQATT